MSLRTSPVVTDFERRLRRLQDELDDLAQTARPQPEPSSCVGKMKYLYRLASKGQRAMMRAWMRRVLTGEDGKP